MAAASFCGCSVAEAAKDIADSATQGGTTQRHAQKIKFKYEKEPKAGGHWLHLYHDAD